MSQLAILGGHPLIERRQPLSKMFVEYPFAERFAQYVGAKYALPTSSGTSALICSLLGAGVGPGDEVITVSHTWFCTATSILQVGAIPIFIDVESETFMMDPGKIESRITERTKAILSVSLYGHPSQQDRIMEIGKRHGITVIDDACQSVGARLNGKPLGSITDITAFSFSGKPIVSTGGGILTTNNEAFFERSMLGGEHPSFISTKAKNPDIWKLASTGGYGNHYRIDGKCAERAYEQLEKLDALNDYRRANAQYLTEKLKNIPGIKTPTEALNAHHIYHMYTCLFDGTYYGITRDEFVDALNAEGLPTMTYISSINFLKDLKGKSFSAGPLHHRHLFQELARTGRCGPFQIPKERLPDYSVGSLPVTEKLVDREFNIHQRFLSAPFTKQTMDTYAEAIKKVLHHSPDIIKNRATAGQRKPCFFVAYESDS